MNIKDKKFEKEVKLLLGLNFFFTLYKKTSPVYLHWSVSFLSPRHYSVSEPVSFPINIPRSANPKKKRGLRKIHPQI